MSVYAGPADWWTDGTDDGRTHIATKGIVQSGLTLNLDAGVSKSYSGSGTSWADLTGINVAASLTAGVTYDSVNGGRLTFNGTTDLLTAPVSSSLSAFTVSFCIYLDPTIAWANRFDILSTDIPAVTNGRFILYRFDATTLRLQATLPSLSVYGVNISSADTLFTGTWKHVTITSVTVSTTTTILIYIDGTLYTTLSIPEAATAVNSSILMMRAAAAGTYAVKGKLASVNVYSRDLTAAEVLKNFNSLRGRFGI